MDSHKDTKYQLKYSETVPCLGNDSVGLLKNSLFSLMERIRNYTEPQAVPEKVHSPLQFPQK
jgi:hypothetical protein